MKEPRLKIIHVIARLNVGGPTVNVITSAEGLRLRGHEVLVVAGVVPAGEASMEYLAEERGISIDHVSRMSRKLTWWNDLASLVRLSMFLRQQRPDVVHTHTAKAGALGRLAALFTGVPVLIHIFHGHVFRGYFSRTLTRIFIAIERFLARHTDCLIAISPAQKHDLSNVFHIAPENKIVTLPLGFDLAPYVAVGAPCEKFRSSISCTSDAPLIAWIGRLTPIKAPELFINAAELIREQEPEARFALVGDGELAAQCKTQIERSRLTSHIALCGNRRQMEQIYADLDLLVLTSVNEGTPLVLLEAMAAARPFVAVDVGGVRDLMVGAPRPVQNFRIFDNGILVSRDAPNIADAVLHLLHAPSLRHAMGQAGREFVRTRFSAERMVDELETLYLKILRSKGKVPERATSAASLPSQQ